MIIVALLASFGGVAGHGQCGYMGFARPKPLVLGSNSPAPHKNPSSPPPLFTSPHQPVHHH